MKNIIIELPTIANGQTVTFRSPVDCSEVKGLVVNYFESGVSKSKAFEFADSHGNNVGDIDDLFAEDVLVKVILDTTNSKAYVQNADTNAYLEGRFDEMLPKAGGRMTGPATFNRIILQRGVNYGTEEEMKNRTGMITGEAFFVLEE